MDKTKELMEKLEVAVDMYMFYCGESSHFTLDFIKNIFDEINKLADVPKKAHRLMKQALRFRPDHGFYELPSWEEDHGLKIDEEWDYETLIFNRRR